MDNDLDLDALLAEAAATPTKPSEALSARILADATAMQRPLPAQRGTASRKRFGLWRWVTDLVAGLGGGPAVAGLSLAGVAGLFLGVADPVALQSITALLSSDTTMVARMDLLPATDILWTEN